MLFKEEVRRHISVLEGYDRNSRALSTGRSRIVCKTQKDVST